MKNIQIATPTVDRKVFDSYMLSVTDLITDQQIRQAGYRFLGLKFLYGSLLGEMRNAYISQLIGNPDISYLLFIDSDIGFRPSAVRRMLEFDKPFVACAYPKRTFDAQRIHSVSREIEDSTVASNVWNNYVGTDLVAEGEEGRVVVNQGFARSHQVGMGLKLIRRDVIEQIAEKFPELICQADSKYRDLGVNGVVLQAFHAMRNDTGVL